METVSVCADHRQTELACTWGLVCFAEEGQPVCMVQLGKVLSHGEQAGCTPRKCEAHCPVGKRMSGRSGRVKPASLAGECGIKKGQSHSVEECALRCMSAVLEISK